jgi:predicted KAP-like P-loop ATPase
VTQLITHEYKTTGVKGEDYIKKIIQIPIKIPTWSKESIIDLIENKINTLYSVGNESFEGHVVVARILYEYEKTIFM